MKQLLRADFDDLHLLLESLFEDRLSVEEFRRLETLVVSDTARRREYIERLNLHAALRWNRADSESTLESAGCLPQTANSSFEPDNVRQIPPSILRATGPSRFSRIGTTLLVAAALYGAFGLIAANISPVQKSLPAPNEAQVTGADPEWTETVPVATIVTTENCIWSKENRDLRTGTRLAATKLQLLQGTAEIVFANGVHAVMEGPCSFELRSPDSTYLAAGRVAAHVPQSAVGFTVETPSAKVVDLGTEFGVEVSDSGDTSVHVLRGAVTLADRGAGRPPTAPLRLTGGEAASVDNLTGVVSEGGLYGSSDRIVRLASRRKFSPPRTVDLSNATATESRPGLTPPNCAIDGKPDTFTHTPGDGTTAWWQIDLKQPTSIAAIVVLNRENCCGGRLRDLRVIVLAEDGKTEVYRSQPLNRENAWGGDRNDFEHGPPQIAVDLMRDTGQPVRGRYVRIERSTCSLSDQENDDDVLSIGEFQVFASVPAQQLPDRSEASKKEPQ